jgi:Flp pilus assembly protein TadG
MMPRATPATPAALRRTRRGFARIREEHGQAIIFPAFMLAFLLGMSGFVLDVGNWYQSQRAAQAVADASALAAAQALPGDTTDATAQALNYAKLNGGVLAASDITYSTGDEPNDTVTVKVNKTEPTYFAKLFGINSVTVHTTATARAFKLAEAQYAAPFAIVNTQPQLAGPGCPCYHVPTTLDLEKVGPGGFKIINIDGSRGGNGGPGTMADWIQNGFSGDMALGWFYSMPGAKFNSSQVKDALDARLNTDMLFPIYDAIQGNGANLQYHVIGWAAFKPTSYTFHGNSGTISGSFDHVTWSGVGGTGGVDDGPVSVGLID